MQKRNKEFINISLRIILKRITYEVTITLTANIGTQTFCFQFLLRMSKYQLIGLVPNSHTTIQNSLCTSKLTSLLLSSFFGFFLSYFQHALSFCKYQTSPFFCFLALMTHQDDKGLYEHVDRIRRPDFFTFWPDREQ